MMMISTQPYIGQTIAFPVQIDGNNNTVIVGGSDNIKQCLLEVLSTPKGTLFFNPAYGSRVHLAVFKTIDDVMVNLTKTLVIEAVEDWEPRVQVGWDDIDIQTVPEKKQVLVTVWYTEVRTKKRDYVTVPFSKAA